MSPHQHYEIARARQQEIVNAAISSHGSQAPRTTRGPNRGGKHRLAQVAAALAVCVGAGTAATISDAHSNQPVTKPHVARVSAQKLEREIRGFEAKGYVPTSCTVDGTLMRNYSTGESVTVEW
jgi:hypothetical protein